MDFSFKEQALLNDVLPNRIIFLEFDGVYRLGVFVHSVYLQMSSIRKTVVR